MMSYMEGLDEYILNMCDLIQTQINEENKKSLRETVIILVRDKILNQKRMKKFDVIRKQIEGGLKK